MLHERLTRALLLQVRSICQNVLQVTESLDELLRRLLANAGYARNVVRRITYHREKIDGVLRLHSQPLRAVRYTNPLLLHARRPATTGIEQPYLVANELVEVLVTTHHHHLHTLLRTLTRQGSDYIVCLVARHGEYRDVIRSQKLLDALHPAVEVRLQFISELLARCLVIRVLLRSERKSRIVHPAQVLGPVLLEKTLKEVRYAPRRRRVLTATGCERPGDEREKGAIDQRVAVYEKEARTFGRCDAGHREY